MFPLSSVWTGAPQGTPWNIPTAAIENAAGNFVPPSEAAAAASEADATMDPTTNLVTFTANPNNAAAYNNYMMVESYLVVPTSGLTAAKAAKLAQYIRFVVGPVAQSDEETLGAAPPTPAMVAADLKVATELDAEAATSISMSIDRPERATSVDIDSTTSTTAAASTTCRITGTSATGADGKLGERHRARRYRRVGCRSAARGWRLSCWCSASSGDRRSRRLRRHEGRP